MCIRDRICGNNIHVEFPAQAFLDDFHVEQAQEAAAEAEAEGHGRFRLEGKGSVIDLELGHGGLQRFKIRGINRVNAGKDHGADFLEACLLYTSRCV